MPLDFSTITYNASIALADFTGQIVITKFRLTANSMAQAISQAQIITNRVKAISAHQVDNIRITASYADVDADPPADNVENVAYFSGETTTGRWAVVPIPGYNGPLAFQNNIDLSNTLVNDLLILFLAGGIVYAYHNQAMSEFCRGWVLTRNKQFS